jgi:hypothetical protein
LWPSPRTWPASSQGLRFYVVYACVCVCMCMRMWIYACAWCFLFSLSWSPARPFRASKQDIGAKRKGKIGRREKVGDEVGRCEK